MRTAPAHLLDTPAKFILQAWNDRDFDTAFIYLRCLGIGTDTLTAKMRYRKLLNWFLGTLTLGCLLMAYLAAQPVMLRRGNTLALSTLYTRLLYGTDVLRWTLVSDDLEDCAASRVQLHCELTPIRYERVVTTRTWDQVHDIQWHTRSDSDAPMQLDLEVSDPAAQVSMCTDATKTEARHVEGVHMVGFAAHSDTPMRVRLRASLESQKLHPSQQVQRVSECRERIVAYLPTYAMCDSFQGRFVPQVATYINIYVWMLAVAVGAVILRHRQAQYERQVTDELIGLLQEWVVSM